MSDLASEYQSSGIAATWRVLWRLFPNFSAKHAPIFISQSGAVLWNQGFGRVAYLNGGKVLLVGWALGASPNERRVLVSQAKHWEPPNAATPISEVELETLVALLQEKCSVRGEKLVLQ